MTDVLSNLKPGARVALIRLRSLGDCVLTTPAIHLLKLHRPDLQIAVVVEDRFAAIFAGNPDIRMILPPAVASVAKWSPELCLNLHGGTRSIVLTAASRARIRAGLAHFRARVVYNVRIPRAQEILGEDRTVHTAEHVASAMFYLGVPQQPIPRARLFAATPMVERPYTVLHPFAATPEKTWPADRFLAVAQTLEREHGMEPVFIAGPADDASLFRNRRVVAGASLEEVKNLISGASLFIGNDSGPAHIAAAFGIPVVVLFGPSNEKIWAPWGTEAEVLKGQPRITDISLEQVQEAASRLRVAR